MLLRFLFNLFGLSDCSDRRQKAKQNMKMTLLAQQGIARDQNAKDFLLQRDLREARKDAQRKP
jgi:hypothetical protein